MKASYLDGRKIIVDDKVYLYLFGTSYLGLPYDEDFQKLIQEGIDKYGSSLGSSPTTVPQLSIYGELEAYLANQYGFEDALLFPSGYSAGQTVVQLYASQNYKIQYGNVAHPALKLEAKIESKDVHKKTNRSTLFATDFIDPITFEQYDINFIDSEGDKTLIDISHGLGLFDDDLKSMSSSSNVILCGSLNKALGINAGILLCDTALKLQVIASARYKTASAPSPSECYALYKAIASGVVEKRQSRLETLLIKLNGAKGLRSVVGFPAVKIENDGDRIFNYLKQNEVLTWRNKYPTADSPMVNRAVFTAAHKAEDVDQFLELIDKFGNENI